MARAFDQILNELGSAYDPSAALIKQQIDAIPGSTEALIKQADAKKDQAFEQIVGGARRRGMGFSGIPLDEQAQYASTEYAPAIANLKSNAEKNRLGFLEQMNALNRDRRTQAQGIYDNELARDFQNRQFQEQVRQFNEQMKAQERQAAAARAAASSGGGGGIGSYLSMLGGGGSKQAAPSYGFKNGKNGAGGFYFKDAGGKSISAAKYAQLAGVSMLDLTRKMVAAGDKGANSILGGPGIMKNNTYKKAFAWDL